MLRSASYSRQSSGRAHRWALALALLTLCALSFAHNPSTRRRFPAKKALLAALPSVAAPTRVSQPRRADVSVKRGTNGASVITKRAFLRGKASSQTRKAKIALIRRSPVAFQADPPEISVSTLALEFGDVPVGVPMVRQLTIFNMGTGSLTVNAATITNPDPANPEFEVLSSLPLTVPANNAPVNLIVRYTARVADATRVGTLSLSTNDPDENPLRVMLTAHTVTAPARPMGVPAPPVTAQVVAGANNPANVINTANQSNVTVAVTLSSSSTATDVVRARLVDRLGNAVESPEVLAPPGAGMVNVALNASTLLDGSVSLFAIARNDKGESETAVGALAVKRTSNLTAPAVTVPSPLTTFNNLTFSRTAPAGSLVHAEGGAALAAQQMAAAQAYYTLSVPLRHDGMNTLVIAAHDAMGNVASADPFTTSHSGVGDVSLVQVFSRPLAAEEVNDLLLKNRVDAPAPNDSGFVLYTLVIKSGGLTCALVQPVALPKTGGAAWGGVGFEPFSSGGLGRIFVVRTPNGRYVVGALIVQNQSRRMHEFFRVTVLARNDSDHTLSDFAADLNASAGLTPYLLGQDTPSPNTQTATDSLSLGSVAPGGDALGTFTVRGDQIGSRSLSVGVTGALMGGNLPDPLPVDLNAQTALQIVAPPSLTGSVNVPASVNTNEIFALGINATNVGTATALYGSVEVLAGSGAELVDENGTLLPSVIVRAPGQIPPAQVRTFSVRVRAKASGGIVVCQSASGGHLRFLVQIGGACPPGSVSANADPPDAQFPPTVLSTNPAPHQGNVATSLSDVTIAFSTPIGNVMLDTFKNLMFKPDAPDAGSIVSADLDAMGNVALQELAPDGSVVFHVPLNRVTGTLNTVARLQLGTPGHPYRLKPDTTYRLLVRGGMNGVNNTSTNAPMVADFASLFHTQPSNNNQPPTVIQVNPNNNATNVPLTQPIIVDFSEPIDPATARINTATPLNSTFSVWQGANIVNNEVSGGQLVNGTLRFTNDFSRLMFTPAARWQASTNYVVRLTRGIRDRSNVALPANVLSRFTTQAPDTTPPDPPRVNPVPAFTKESAIHVTGRTKPNARVEVNVEGGSAPFAGKAGSSGFFSVYVSLLQNAVNRLRVRAIDTAGNVGPETIVDINGSPLHVTHDNLPPTIVNVNFTNDQRVPVDFVPTVRFSEALNPASVATANVQLTTNGQPIAGQVQLTAPDTVTFTPTQPLPPTTMFVFTVRAGGISDVAGNAIQVGLQRGFKTGPAAPPTIAMFFPPAAPIGTPVTVTGINFDPTPGGTQVFFAGTQSVITSITATTLVTQVPLGAQTGKIAVQTIAGTGVSAEDFTVTVSQDFTLNALPTSGAVLQGDDYSYVITATGANNFIGLIALSLTNALPNGVTATFNPPQITAGGSSTLTFKTTSTTPVGNLNLNLTGTAVIEGQTIVKPLALTLNVLPVTTTTITGRVLNTTDEPLRGVIVQLGNANTMTDAGGNFLLGPVPVGKQMVFVDGRPASTPQAQYPHVDYTLDIVANQVNRTPFIVYLPKLDTERRYDVAPSGAERIIRPPTIPGLEIKIPANTTIYLHGGHTGYSNHRDIRPC